jgi:hypothetical protein
MVLPSSWLLFGVAADWETLIFLRAANDELNNFVVFNLSQRKRRLLLCCHAMPSIGLQPCRGAYWYSRHAFVALGLTQALAEAIHPHLSGLCWCVTV